MTTTAQYVANFLAARGVARVYGMPGGESTELMVALRERGVPFVLVHHEAVASFAADAAGYLTGQPAVCLSTLGPGAANLFSGVSNAYLERAPLLAITADIEPGAKATTTHQHFSLSAIFGSVTKASHVLTADNAAAVLPGAWDLATDGVPGPVHVALSRAEAGRPLVPREPIELERRVLPAPDLRRIQAGLAAARRPVIAVGVGCAHSGAEPALRRLAEHWGAPVVCTPKGKGHLPESHPLFIGTYGIYGWKPVDQVLAQADAVLAVGLDGCDFIPAWRYACPVYSLSPGWGPDPTYPQTELAEGDLCAMLEELAAGPAPAVAWTAAEVAGYRQQVLSILAPRPETVFAPQHVIDSLRRVMPDHGVVSCDVGSHKLLIGQQWRAEQPRTFLVANGGSAMGYGISSALGAALLNPDRPTATVMGDGGLLMYPGDLETLQRTQARALIIVLVDRALALIRNQQQRVGADPYGVEFGQPDYLALGRAFGVHSAEVRRPEDCDAVLRTALAQPGPSLVMCHVDASEYRRF